MNMHIALFFLLFLIQNTNGSFKKNDISNITWESQISMAKTYTRTLLRGLLPKLYRTVSEANITSACERSLVAYSLALMQLKPWAIKMSDASAKIPSGILEGTLMELGAMEECLSIRVAKSSGNATSGKELFRGQHCTLSFQHVLFSSSNKEEPPEFLKDLDEILRGKIPFVFGYCVPSACSKNDVGRLASTILEPLGIMPSVLDCAVDETLVWPSSAIIAVSILCIIASLCIIGTTLDYLHCIKWNVNKKDEDKGLIRKVLEAFSILSNTETFFKRSSDNDIGCFHGLKTLSASWIIYGNNYNRVNLFKYIESRRNLTYLEKLRVFSEGLLENYTMSVTTFFVLSGFLMVKTTWKKLEKNDGKLNFFEFILHKYWRLTPCIAFTIVLLNAAQVMDSGPMWNPVMNVYVNQCDGYWWANLLYINNWLPGENMCMGHTWFVAALMQMHIVGFILLLVAYRWKNCGILTGILLSIACYAVITYFVIINNVPSTIRSLIKDDKGIKYFETVYSKPYFNLTPYMIGMFLAYLYEKYSYKKYTKKYQALGWIFAVTFAIFSIYGAYLTPYNKPFSIFYHMMHRTSWAVSISWIIYICISGCGGIINKILSCRLMYLLGKLSYLMYLTHYLVLVYIFASAKERSDSGKTQHVIFYISVFVISMVISFIGYVTVEVPFSRLDGLLFRRETKTQ